MTVGDSDSDGMLGYQRRPSSRTGRDYVPDEIEEEEEEEDLVGEGDPQFTPRIGFHHLVEEHRDDRVRITPDGAYRGGAASGSWHCVPYCDVVTKGEVGELRRLAAWDGDLLAYLAAWVQRRRP